MTTLTKETKDEDPKLKAPVKAPEQAPKAAETQTAKEPEGVKEVLFRKVPGEKWKMTVKGGVQMRDINHLRRAIVVEWNRMKRRIRMTRRKFERLRDEKNKEIVNG